MWTEMQVVFHKKALAGGNTAGSLSLCWLGYRLYQDVCL